MKLKSLLFVATTLLFTACTTDVQLPKNRISTTHNTTNLQSKLKPYPKDKVPYQNILDISIKKVAVDDKNMYGIKITPKLKKLYDSYLNGNYNYSLKLIRDMELHIKDSNILWQTSFFKIKTLMDGGFLGDALKEIPNCIKYEKKSFNSNLNCSALKAQINLLNGDIKSAKNISGDILLTIGNWEIPTSYNSPPSNMPQLVATTTAQIRAYIVLALAYNFQEDYKKSFYFANEAEKRLNSIQYLSKHWLYGRFVTIHLDTIVARATNLVILASSKLALNYPQKEVDKDFENALTIFKKMKYLRGIAIAMALKARVYNRLGKHDICYTEGAKAIKYAKDHKFWDIVWRVQLLRGDTLLAKNMKKEAQKSYKMAYDMLKKVESNNNYQTTTVLFGIRKSDLLKKLSQIDSK